MAKFIDLTDTSASKIPPRRVFQHEEATDGSISSLQASTNHRPPLLKPSPPQSKGSLPLGMQSVNRPQVINKTSTKSRGPTAFDLTSSNHDLEANGFMELSPDHKIINGAFPSPKRRCGGLNRTSYQDSTIKMTSHLLHEGELELAEVEDRIMDLTINENFPILRTKRSTSNLLDVSPAAAAVPSTSLHEARARTKRAVKRRLAALGRNIQGDYQDFVDLSADTDSEEEETELSRDTLERSVYVGPETARHAAWRPSIIGPEDYLSDDEISQRLAELVIGPEREIAALPRSLARTEIDVFSHGDLRCKAGESVELRNGNFLRIVSVLKDKKGDMVLSGHLLSRQSLCGRFMPKRRNELVWIVEMNREDFEAGLDPKLHEIRVTQALCVRNVTFTNQRYPDVSINTHVDSRFKSAREEITDGPLFCRWKSIKVIADRKQRHEDSLVHLTYDEADPKPNAKVRPAVLRDMWRGTQTILGGSHLATRDSSIDLMSHLSLSTSEKVQEYTFGDAFCGAGGCSVGALQAGLRVKWGFDKDKDAIKVYATNLGRREGAESLREAVDEFCGRSDITRFIVDILHMSPPCQPFSPAHTVPNEIQDEINQAALFSVLHLLEKIKPRIATVEETEGLMNRHLDWFQALINIFSSLGYSVRWKVIRCQDHGVPQQRRRLLIIAAGPGEKLPPFMKPTHGAPGSGLQPFRTIAHCIRDIPPGASHHDTSDYSFSQRPKTPFSGNQFARTLTCSGGVGNYHPSGLRLYTVRELACLQTFPLWCTFTPNAKTKARRQIGNAVPPMVARSMYREIVKCLKEADRLEALMESGQS